MARKHESNKHIEAITRAEVFAAIRYLDRDLRSANEQQSYDTGVVTSVIVVILVLGALFFLFCKV
jgi:hypothetical protein